ncbi:hypothetical protein M2302_000246 [Micromonospora sp. A200]|uniref:hypothetical protein n=1 Tax=Micromonospora sp. A200 TaxID=2940568 RepID=UPI002474FC18|nr:hypothetical protein [Micromonospora sp. A200]MDH6460095.1 hypothetical protein [Micromonospora sp. A200]
MSTNRTVRVFYAVVLATALGGSVTAAAAWLDVPWWVAVGPIAAAELGGVVLMRHANDRRKLGERAFAAMGLSFAFAALAVATNVLGHAHIGMAAFFGGFSALGYLVYLLIQGAERRDALRAAGKLEDTAPAYGVWQWVRHPGITRRARLLAQAGSLPRGASLAAAREQVRAERRQKAIATALDKLIREKAGPVMAEIAVNTYDVEHIARRIAERADLDGYAALISGDLTPAKLAGEKPAIKPPPGDTLTAVMDATTPTAIRTVTDAVSAPSPAPVMTTIRRPAKKPSGRRQMTAAEKVTAAVTKLGADASLTALMKEAGVSESSVLRHRPKPPAAVNGHRHAQEV